MGTVDPGRKRTGMTEVFRTGNRVDRQRGMSGDLRRET